MEGDGETPGSSLSDCGNSAAMFDSVFCAHKLRASIRILLTKSMRETRKFKDEPDPGIQRQDGAGNARGETPGRRPGVVRPVRSVHDVG